MCLFTIRQFTKLRAQRLVGQNLATVERKMHGYRTRVFYYNTSDFKSYAITLEYNFGRVNLHVNGENHTEEYVRKNKHKFKVTSIEFG